MHNPRSLATTLHNIHKQMPAISNGMTTMLGGWVKIIMFKS